MFKTQLVFAMISAIGAIISPFGFGTGKDNGTGASQPEQPHFVAAPYQRAEVKDFEAPSYADPLEQRVTALEARASTIEASLAKVADMKASSVAAVETPKGASATPGVDSRTVTESSKSKTISIAEGATAGQIVDALKAIGVSAYETKPAHQNSSYGSSGGTAISYSGGSTGSSTYQGSAYGSSSTAYSRSVYAVPYYNVSTVPIAANVVSSQPRRSGIFQGPLRRATAPATCRIVNGQVVCD